MILLQSLVEVQAAANSSLQDETSKVLTDLVCARLSLVKITSCGDGNAVIGQAGFEAVGT